MEITINGKKRQDFTAPLTIAELLEHLGINPKSVVVERNLAIVDKHQMDEAAVQDGDQIEIIRLVGGG
jgi:thiamine biosynthesis protein ThiS